MAFSITGGYGSFTPTPTYQPGLVPPYPTPTPTTTTTTPSGGSGGGGSGSGGTGGYQIPSLSDILGGDPLYQQALANLNATSVQTAAQRDAARSRALIGFGAAPDLSGVAGLVGQYTPDAQTLALAQQNTAAGLSTEARLQAADQQARQQIMNVLGARGLYSSGETGYQYGKEATGYRQSQYDATQKLVDYLAGVQQQYLSAVQAQQAQQYQYEQQALSNWLAMNPYGGQSGGGGGDGGGGGTGGGDGSTSTAPVYTGPTPQQLVTGAVNTWPGTSTGLFPDTPTNLLTSYLGTSPAPSTWS